ncbi:MAG: hypothetical protein JO025_03580 [Verrucomicrobia bacterium]|nr:hypothetical protein [Verrucomicrobiota bacterium]
MSQFLYIHFKVTPKGVFAKSAQNQTVGIELPVKHVEDWKQERPHLTLSDQEVAVEVAYPVAIAAAGKFLPLTNSPLREREIHSPAFLPKRLGVMNERPSDYEDNGIRAWFIDENA